ncbi:MAG: class III poly(R)-hydroxyalkanoic acid synthase subunit PhaE [Chromatiales bacterium]|jgi:class III poly(R)-hydroxyalkanoic acid synthase PhaE subunit
MAENNPWLDSWMQAQQQFWNKWSEMAAGASPQVSSPANAWAEGMERWWKQAAPSTPDLTSDLYEKLMETGKSFFSMAEGFGKSSHPMEHTHEHLNHWFDQMKENYRQLHEGGASLGEQARQGAKDFMAFWEVPMESWHKTAHKMMPHGIELPSFYGFDPQKPEGQLFEQMRKMLTMPQVGYSREGQEQLQQLGRLAIDYQEASNEYNKAFARVALESIEEFQKVISGIDKDAPLEVDSLRDLYTTWINVCEDIYADFAMSEEYQTIYGRMVNAFMALKKETEALMDKQLEAFNMPTRKEVDAISEKLQQVKRENRKLRAELEGIKARLDDAAAPKKTARAVTKKRVAKKAAAKKKVAKKAAAKKKATVKRK